MTRTLKTKECDLLLVVVPDYGHEFEVANNEPTEPFYMTYLIENERIAEVEIPLRNAEILGEIDHEGNCSFDVESFIDEQNFDYEDGYYDGTLIPNCFEDATDSFLSLMRYNKIPLPKEVEKYVVLRPI